MDGRYGDDTRVAPMKKILDTNAKNNPNEAVIQEVPLLLDIQVYQQNDTENVLTSVNRFKGSVARYVNQKKELNKFMEHRFAIIMMRSARLPAHTINHINFQLATNKNNVKKGREDVEITTSIDEAGLI